MIKKVIPFIIIIILFGFILYYFRDSEGQPETISDNFLIEKGVNTGSILENEDSIQVIAENLEIPWEIAFLPDNEILLTERPGRLIKIGKDRTVIEISGVNHTGEGGLLGMTLHPDFDQNSLIYLYLTSEIDGNIINRVEKYKFNGDSLSDREVVLDGIPGASYHDGGRIEFGPDGYLYITTGDAGVVELAQDTDSLAGKILRVDENGGIAEDNPFGNEVYSYGHRNPQGLTWDNQGRLWSTEHGRSGALSGFDELNLIEKGKNYGWPDYQGDDIAEGIQKPALHSGATVTWAPSDIEFVDGKLFFSGLRGASIYEVRTDGADITGFIRHFENEYGRIRITRLGPDGYLYIGTSNRDGRGDVNERDDRLIKVDPEIFR